MWVRQGEGELHSNTINSENNVIPAPAIRARIPLISWVRAGAWTEIEENHLPADPKDWLISNRAYGHRTFALRVLGDSMAPRFPEGCIIIVDPDSAVDTGSFVIAKINGNEATFKQLIKDGGRIYLRPLNDRYQLLDVTGQELIIIGAVKEKRIIEEF